MNLQITNSNAVVTGSDLKVDRQFFNRELSWLRFNERVLYQALDDRTPLLERLGFLAIFNSNLDEFFQKRVGGLKRQIAAGVQQSTPDGLSARETLTQIRDIVTDLLRIQAECYTKVVRPELAEHGIDLLSYGELGEDGVAFCRAYYANNLFPMLTPLAVDPGHPFPFISNLSTSLGVMLQHPDRAKSKRSSDMQFARVKVPVVLPQWVKLPSTDGRTPFVRLDEIIAHNLHDLFEGMEVVDIMPFRVSRNADVERDEEDAEDLLELIEQELRDRRFAPVVRLEVGPNPNERMVRFLMEELELEESDVYHMNAELDYTDMWAIHGAINAPDLKYEPWSPQVPGRLADDEADIFSVIRGGDVLVHHPYESFTASVERFVRAAARDPKVVAIKQTLYRTSSDSPFIPELMRAAESGKQVVCLVELKARFDEERNIQVAQELEGAGVHVVYGVVGFKTHTKTAMVVRHESEGMRVYAHIGTGNYNSKTAQLYTDLGLFTCDKRLTGELVELFHYLTGRSVKREFEHLLVAPVNMRDRFDQMIDREIEHCAAWKDRGGDPDDPNRPRITAKMNSLEDRCICERLYEASQAGVSIDLIVRGFCCLVPGVPGMSENIRVVSVIGRFLEHSRIFCFHNNGEPEYYIGSADWMYRNLNNRVECITPIYDPPLQQKLQRILDISLDDHRQAWDMQADGSYVLRNPLPDHEETDVARGTHLTLMSETLSSTHRTPAKTAR